MSYRSSEQNRDYEKTAVYENSGSYFHADKFIRNFVQMNTDEGGDPFLVLQDPTFCGFKIFFHFGSDHGLLADESYTDSALAHFNRRGDTNRYALLKKFINTLSRVNSYTPWMFQTIDGLENLYTDEIFTANKYSGELNIGTLESVDWKIQSIVSMYRQLVWDDIRKVETLPMNLREFSMSVYVYDVRYFRDDIQFNKDYLQTLATISLDEITHNMYEFSHCSFGMASGSSFLGTIANNSVEMSTNNLVVKYGNFNESSLFSAITGDLQLNALAMSVTAASVNSLDDASFTRDTQTIEFDQQYGSQTERAIRTIGKNISGSAIGAADAFKTATSINSIAARADSLLATGINSVYNNLKGQLSSLYLGNVYGFRLGRTLSGLANTNTNELRSLASNSGAGPSINNYTRNINSNDNVYGS